MNTECLRIAEQVRLAFAGKAWHGPSLKDLLADVSAQQAHARPIAQGHSIAELVSHIEVWAQAATNAVHGVPMPTIVGTAKDWPATDPSDSTWDSMVTSMFASAEELANAVKEFEDARLADPVPGRQYDFGRKYDFYYLFHGVIQHSLYHGGQIALLKRAVAS